MTQVLKHGGAAARWLLIAAGLFVLLRVPSDEVLYEDIAPFLKSLGQLTFAFGNIFLVDFFLAFITSLAVTVALFWRAIFAPEGLRPRWGRFALRAIDVAWYLGAAATLALAIAQLQASFARENYEDLVTEQRDQSAALSEQFGELARSCNQTFSLPTEGASTDLMAAFQLHARVCAVGDWVGDPFSPSPIEGNCTGIAVDERLWHRSRSSKRPPPYAQDLLSNEGLYRAVLNIRRLCQLQGEVADSNQGIDVLRAMTENSKPLVDGSTSHGFFRFFAFLIALRLTRTLSELVDEWRALRRSSSGKNRSTLSDATPG